MPLRLPRGCTVNAMVDLRPRLLLAKQGRWLEMAGLIDDHMLDAFTVRCERPADVAAALHARYDGLVDRIAVLCHADPHRAHPEAWADVVAAIRRDDGRVDAVEQ